MSRTEFDSVQRPLSEFRLTRSVAIQWTVVSVVGFFGFAYCFGHVFAKLRGTALEPIVISPSSPPTILGWLAVSAGLLACVVIPHELLHGVFLARYGGAPEYGVGVSHFVVPYAYAGAEGASYSRNELLVALLAPFVVITAVGLALLVVFPSPLLVVPLAANAAGSIGDLWMAAVLCQYPADVRVAALPESDAQGFGIYGASGRESARLPGMRPLSAAVTGGVGTLAVVSTGFLAAVLLSLAAGSGDVVIADPTGRWVLFRHERWGNGTAALEIGAGPLLGAAGLGGLAWALVTTVRRRLGSKP